MIDRLLRKIKSAYAAGSVKSFSAFVNTRPDYANLERIWRDCQEELRPAYEYYIKNVSRADMAASLELAAAMLALCRLRRWQRVLDVGSGFSSYVFRRYARDTPGVTVVSVDDDKEWLNRTSGFLEGQNVSTDNMFWLDDFLRTDHKPFDCILHDQNFVEVRILRVPDVLSRLATDGLLIFDDVHKPDYRSNLLDILRKQEGTTFSLKPVTLDGYGRYAFAFVACAS